MEIIFDRTDGPHGMLLVRVGARELGYINRPPELRGRYRAYSIAANRFPVNTGFPSALRSHVMSGQAVAASIGRATARR